MSACLRHESFYRSGVFSEERTGLHAAWTSHPGSFSARGPVWNEAHDIGLLFAGEHLGMPEDAARLRAGGHADAADDVRGLVHLYEEEGPAFLAKLDGWFHGVLADTRDRKVILFNDRYGLKRIYWHEDARGFYFASEAKCLLKVLPELRRIDPAGLGEWLACGCVLQDRSLFAGVSLLPPGSAWVFDASGGVRRGAYFNRSDWEQQPLRGEEEYDQALTSTFARAMRRCVRPGEAIGMSLTGGLDGRMIMAWNPRGPGELPCYSFGGPYRDCLDVRIARRVAGVCRQPHDTIRVGDEFLSEFPSLAEKTVRVTDGAMDVTGAVEVYVNRLARRLAPIRLTGNYGSEVLRGKVAFRPMRVRDELFDPQVAAHARTAAATYEAEASGGGVSFIAFKQVPWYHYARFAAEDSQITVRSPYLDAALVQLVYQAPPGAIASPRVALRLIAEGRPALGAIATDMGVTGRPIPLLTACQRAWREGTARAEYMYDYGMPQWLARVDGVLAPLHPERMFLGRHKFYHFRVWYRERLAPYVRDILLDPRTRARPYLNGRRLEAMVGAHVSGRANHTLDITRLLSMELIHRLLVEQA